MAGFGWPQMAAFDLATEVRSVIVRNRIAEAGRSESSMGSHQLCSANRVCRRHEERKTSIRALVDYAMEQLRSLVRVVGCP